MNFVILLAASLLAFGAMLSHKPDADAPVPRPRPFVQIVADGTHIWARRHWHKPHKLSAEEVGKLMCQGAPTIYALAECVRKRRIM